MLTTSCLQPLEHLVSAFSSIGSADASDSTPVSDVIPNVYSALTLAPAEEDGAKSQSVEALTLPMVLVPPESDDGDLTLNAATAIERAIPAPPITAGLRGDEGIGYDGVRLLLRLFDDEVSKKCAGPTCHLTDAALRRLSPLSTNRPESSFVLWCTTSSRCTN